VACPGRGGGRGGGNSFPFRGSKHLGIHRGYSGCSDRVNFTSRSIGNPFDTRTKRGRHFTRAALSSLLIKASQGRNALRKSIANSHTRITIRLTFEERSPFFSLGNYAPVAPMAPFGKRRRASGLSRFCITLSSLGIYVRL